MFQGWDVFERTNFDSRCGDGTIDNGFGKTEDAVDCYKKFRTGHTLKQRQV
jgi:hypothetical protein